MTIGIAAAFLGAGTFAYFSDTETSTGNTFTAGTVDIAVDGDNPWTDTITSQLADVKPCEVRWATVTITNPGGNDVDVWKIIKNVVCDQGTSTEPENDEEYTSEALCNIDTVIKYDLEVEINTVPTVIIDESDNEYIDPDIADYYIYLGVLPAGGTMVVKQSYHMDSTVTNWAQGDTMTFDIQFLAQQTSGNPPAPSPLWTP